MFPSDALERGDTADCSPRAGTGRWERKPLTEFRRQRQGDHCSFGASLVWMWRWRPARATPFPYLQRRVISRLEGGT